MLDRLIWESDRLLLDDLVFRLEHSRSESWSGGDEYFRFFKTKGLVDQYGRFFSKEPGFHPQNLFELGTFDGGSSAFWNEWFRPAKHVSIDIMKRTDTPYFLRYVESRGLNGQLKTIWGVDQSDKKRLQSIVESEFNGSLDMVIDDASHLYGPTRASFEALFPYCSKGGLYIIEDWAWGHWEKFTSANHPLAREEAPTRLVSELIESTGTSPKLIAKVTVFHGFVVVQRGALQLPNPAQLNLEDYIRRRSRVAAPLIYGFKLKKMAKDLKKKVSSFLRHKQG